MPKIKIIKSIAKRSLSSQIDEGQRLMELLADAGPITHERFVRVHEEYDRWSQQNASLLSRFFDDDSLKTEYSGIVNDLVDDQNSLLENKTRIRQTTEARVAWLMDLVNRIDDFEQSENTPTPTRH